MMFSFSRSKITYYLTGIVSFSAQLFSGENSIAIPLSKGLFSESTKQVVKDSHLIRSRKLLYWTDRLDKGLQFAKETDKAVLVAFVGTDWCPWSQKLQREILTSPDFLKVVRDRFVLVWIDFPEGSALPSEKIEENERIRNQFDVQELPTIMLLDTKGDLISKCSYLPLSSKEFAHRACELLEDYQLVKERVEEEISPNVSQELLKDLYIKAKKLDNQKLKSALLEIGMQHGKGAFFLLEKYATLIQNDPEKSPEITSIRSRILESDPKDQEHSRLQLAIMDFHRKEESPVKQQDYKKTLKPLLSYLKDFGDKDSENRWKVQLMIAQYLFRKGKVEDAIQHAQASLDNAPEESKADVEQTLSYLKNQ